MNIQDYKKQDKCVRCRVKFTDDNLGYEFNDGYTCNDCYIKERNKNIDDLEQFRQSKLFHDKRSVIQKLLELAENMGNWHDSPVDGTTIGYQDYMDYDLLRLQIILLGHLLTLVEERDEFRTEDDFELVFYNERTPYQNEILSQMKYIQGELHE